MDSFLTIDAPALPPELNIDTGVAPPQPPSEKVAESRSYKAHMGIGDILAMDQKEIYRSIADGQENHLRESAAFDITQQAVEAKQKAIQALAAAKGSNLTLADVTSLDTLPANPKSVIEQSYSRAYVNTVHDAAARLQDSILTDAQAENPEAVRRYLDQGSQVLTRREYAQTKVENLEPVIDRNSWLTFRDPVFGDKHHFGTYDLKQLFSLGFYESAVLRGNTKEASRLGFLGNVLDAQAQELLNLPTDEAFFKEFDKIVGNLEKSDPILAQRFAHVVAGQTTSERYLGNAVEAANLVIAGQALKGVLGARNIIRENQIKNLGDLREGPDGTYRPGGSPPPGPGGPGVGGTAQITSDDLGRGAMSVQEVLRQSPTPTQAQAAQAVRDVVQSAALPEVTKATIAEGAGDVTEAAVQKTVTSITRKDPKADAMDTLLTGVRTDKAELNAKPGNLSRELHTRMIDAAEGFEKNVTELLTNASAVVRTPKLMEDGYRGLAERIKTLFPGRESTIADITFRTLEMGPLTLHADVKIVNYDGNPFSSYELAKNHARLNGYDIPGIEGSLGERVYLPAAALMSRTFTDTFKTSKGSEYTINEDGTTTRNKAARPEHPGEQGIQPKSQKTYYVLDKEINNLAEFQTSGPKKAIVETGNGFIGVKYLEGKDKGKIERRTVTPFKTEPAVGYHPVEVWKNGRSVHFGNPITEVTPAKISHTPKDFEVKRLDDGSFLFTTSNGVEVLPNPNYFPGSVPYNLTTNKFEPIPTGEHAAIVQQGLGFHIIVTKPINETENFIRDGLISGNRTVSSSNKNTSRFTQIANTLLLGGLVRNPYDTLSKVDNENRAKVVFGQSRFLSLIKEEIGVVEDLYKGLFGDNWWVDKPLSYGRTITGANRVIAEQFSRALEASQTMPDRDGLPGYYMKTPLEIQHFWESNFGRPATFKEQEAYLAIGRLDHFDHILRNVGEYRNKSRLGVMRWSFGIVKDGQTIDSPFFDARQIRKVDNNPDDVTIIIDVTGTERVWHKMGTTAQEAFRNELDQGQWTGVEMYDPEKRPIRRKDEDGNDYRIRYIFSNNFKSKPLDFNQIGYRGGGHWNYDFTHAVKQSIIRVQRMGSSVQHIYEGDNTFGFVSNRAMGEDFSKHMNEIARLIRARQYKDAKNYAKKYFDIEWKDLYNGFRPSKNPVTGEMQPARFSTDPRQAFRVVPQGRSIIDLDKELETKYTRRHPKTDAIQSTFVDGTRHGSLARNFQIEYSQTRESYAMVEPYNVGSNSAPFYQFRPAKLADPLATMVRALNRIVNSTYMDDVKYSQIEHWLEENKDLLNATEREIRSSPFYYFNEGKYKNNPDTMLRQIAASTNKYKIQQLVGMPSVVDSAIQGVKQVLSDSLYEAGRDKAVMKLDKIIENTPSTTTKAVTKAVRAPLVAPEWMIDRLSNPIDFGRSMTYHLNLGLFAIKQVVVQSMAYTAIFGLAGMEKAAQGSIAAWMHQWSRLNKNHVDWLDRQVTNFGWRLGEFTEAMKLLDKTGFGVIGNEISMDVGLRKQSFFRSDAKGFFDAGQRPFHEGNLHVRFGAWYTAFKEFRDKYPYVKIGPIEEGRILFRANYLQGLMTRDANTILNKGLVGVPFQFYDYMKKVADIFWGKNLGDNFGTKLVQGEDGVYREVSTNTAMRRSYVRARMFMLYAVLGGVVGATGVTGLPGGDIIRKHALAGDLPGQTGPYVPGDPDNIWATVLMEGPTSTLIAALTGGGDPSKGIFYNLNNRFNPNGFQILRDMMQTDPSFWKILTGAMGNTVAQEIASLSGFTNAMYSMMEGNPAKEAWPLMLEDWLAPLDGVKSWKEAKRLQYALAFGKWLDSHGRPVSDVGKIDAIFRTLTGLTDQRIDDMYLKGLTKKDREAAYKAAFNEFETQSRKAEQAAADGDVQQANDYNKRAFFALTSNNVPVELWGKAIQRRALMNRDTIKKNNESYYLQFVPTNKQQQAIEAYRKIQQMENK